MKSSLLILSLLIAVLSCTPQESNPDASEPGDERSFNPLLVGQNSDLKLSLINLCGALEEKANVLEDYVGRELLAVRYQESDCKGKLSSSVNHEVRIWDRNGKFVFQNDEENFPLTEVETLNSGVMKEICGNLLNLRNPLRVSETSTTAIEFRQIDTSFCRSDSQNVCLQIIKGRINRTGDRYAVNENTMISFRTARGGRTGFYNYKNVKTYGSCGNGRFRTKIATFL